METLNQTTHPIHFRYLSPEAAQDPTIFLEEFCFSRTEIEYFRTDLFQLLQAACCDIEEQDGRYYLDARNYVYNHKQAIEVMELLWVLHQQKDRDYQLSESHRLFQRPRWKTAGVDLPRRMVTAKYYRYLTDEEMNNVALFLQDLFTYKDLDEWREILDELLYFSHSTEIFGAGAERTSEIMPIQEYFGKIAEAIFLIGEIIIKKRGYYDREDSSSFRDINAREDDFLASLITYFENTASWHEEQQQTWVSETYAYN